MTQFILTALLAFSTVALASETTETRELATHDGSGAVVEVRAFLEPKTLADINEMATVEILESELIAELRD